MAKRIAVPEVEVMWSAHGVNMPSMLIARLTHAPGVSRKFLEIIDEKLVPQIMPAGGETIETLVENLTNLEKLALEAPSGGSSYNVLIS